jgi:hypothetical protein
MVEQAFQLQRSVKRMFNERLTTNVLILDYAAGWMTSAEARIAGVWKGSKALLTMGHSNRQLLLVPSGG